jgi:hypothetical protein
VNIPDEYISAIRSLGYTADEARFLYVVATHSGYFVARQFVTFTGASWGKRPDNFTNKVERYGHATWREYMDMGGVYHLFSKTLYRLIDRENLRNRRRHSTEFIRTRLLLLDFVIANPNYRYLETEQDKLRFFCDELGVPKKALPAKAYEGPSTPEPTLRYFVDKFPLFLDSSNGSPSPVVTLSYVDPGHTTLGSFAQHLNQYLPLLQYLAHFHFVYIAASTVHFGRAESCFASLVKAPLRHMGPDELERYFRLREAWERKQYHMLSTEDIEWLDQANQRFGGARVEWLYQLWGSGDAGKQQWRGVIGEGQASQSAEFRTALIRSATVATLTKTRRTG